MSSEESQRRPRSGDCREFREGGHAPQFAALPEPDYRKARSIDCQKEKAVL
jgi:hypothetical protein